MKHNPETLQELWNSLIEKSKNVDLESIPMFRNGSKLIPRHKKGSGIHIKKANRGKFTEYCGGNVTSSCIAKGKRSSSPTIRKRATFAANARKWKHRFGGILTDKPVTEILSRWTRNK